MQVRISGKTVRFATTSELVRYEAHNQHKSDNNKLFYNKQDYRAMKIENHQAVIDVQKMLLPLLSKSRSKNQAGNIINPDAAFGNEKLLTPKLLNQVVVAKRSHRYAVLREQARQHASEEKDPGAIARASQKYSKGAASRARAIGLLQSK